MIRTWVAERGAERRRGMGEKSEGSTRGRGREWRGRGDGVRLECGRRILETSLGSSFLLDRKR
jgi:hypothetical protein